MTDKEKLHKIRELADNMAHSSEYLLLDASHLHKAVYEYRQFIIQYWNEGDVDKLKKALKFYEKNGIHYLWNHEHLPKESASKNLEEAAKHYADGENPTCPCEECLIKTFKDGANWREQQMMKDVVGDYWIARDKNVSRPLNIYEDIPERVHLDDGRKFWRAFHHSVNLPSEIFDEIQWENEPQKVKLIIIKED